jgi:hypothetical protein
VASSDLIAIVHAASGELQARRLPDAAIETALVATLLGALGERMQRGRI